MNSIVTLSQVGLGVSVDLSALEGGGFGGPGSFSRARDECPDDSPGSCRDRIRQVLVRSRIIFYLLTAIRARCSECKARLNAMMA